MAVTDAAAGDGEAAARSKSKVPILLGLFLALALGGAGFFVAYSGILPLPSQTEARADEPSEETMPAKVYSFVPLDPMVVSLGLPGRGRHLRFRAEVEVSPGQEAAVVGMMPRIIDTLNGYLRAVPIGELEEPSALVRLRAQMLRRVQLISPEGAVRDLLIMEFVLD